MNNYHDHSLGKLIANSTLGEVTGTRTTWKTRKKCQNIFHFSTVCPKKNYNRLLGRDYERKDIAIWKVTLHYETVIISLSVSIDPHLIWFSSHKEIFRKFGKHVMGPFLPAFCHLVVPFQTMWNCLLCVMSLPLSFNLPKLGENCRDLWHTLIQTIPISLWLLNQMGWGFHRGADS